MTDDPNQATARPGPGWYPHPSMAHTVRYWDGAAWTDQIAPAPAFIATPSTARVASAPSAAKQVGPAPHGMKTSKILFRVAGGIFLVDLVVVVFTGYFLDDPAASTALWYTGILLTLMLAFIAFVTWLVEAMSRPKP